jgi:hypothetical protein
MNIQINEELKAYIDPLTPQEHEALERSLLAEGCRDALVLWGDVLVDGHNRYGICQQHGLPFQTVQNTRFQSLEDVHLWMIDQHLGRRSVSDFQRGVLALRKRDIVAGLRNRALTATQASSDAAEGAGASLPDHEPLKSREAVARAARISHSQVQMIEKIQQQAAPELLAAVKSGTLSLNAAAVVSSLPAEEQRAAALAGKDELRQAAKRVRESRRKPAADLPAREDSSAAQDDNAPSLLALQQRVGELSAENAALRAELAELKAQLVADTPCPPGERAVVRPACGDK